MNGSSILRKIYGLLAGRPMGFSYIDEYVAGSACPMSKKEVDWLRKRGIKAILSLTESPLKKEWVEELAYKHVPMKDHSIPSQDDLQRAVEFVSSQTDAKQAVAVHCMAGKGRTGTVLASYMCKNYALSPQESISRVRSKRAGSVEKKQIDAVEMFCQSISKK